MKPSVPVTNEKGGHPVAPIPHDHDCDWEYTGAVFRCPDCGVDLSQAPPDVGLCPACGADLYLDEI